VKRLTPFILIVAVLIGGFFFVQYLSRRKPTPTQPLTPSTSKPAGESPKLGAEPPHALGSVEAPVMIEEFGDFECPPCAALHPVLKTMKTEFGPSLVIVFRQFPMSSLHPHAVDAARAAEAAGLQGKFWEMHGQLFENQKVWHEASNAGPLFEEYANKIGLDLTRFRQDLTSSVVEQRIRLDRERANWIGVNGTPTVFLNGREVPFDSLSPEKLRELIKARITP
jgi:protein-disulfide isomerase